MNNSQELINKLNLSHSLSFQDNNYSNYISGIEDELMKDDIIDNPIKHRACATVGYYYGKTHNYEKAFKWLQKVFLFNKKTNYNYDTHNWLVFMNIIFQLIPFSLEEEEGISNTIVKNLDELLDMPQLNINNLLILDHSFWYGYLNTNQKTIYEKYAKLQMKIFPDFSNKIKYNSLDNINNNKIKIGIISASLQPSSLLDNSNIHSSSISDSFYTTFLNLSKDKFEVIFIYYNIDKPSYIKDNYINDNNNVYLSEISTNDTNSVLQAQQQIAELKLDILLYLDLHIHPMLNYLALSKLARVQACTHGHPVTSGISRNIMNYYLSWEAAEIDNAQEHYTEELILLPKNIVWEYYVPRNSKEQMSLLTGKYWGNITRNDMHFLPSLCNSYKNWYFCAQAAFKLHFTFVKIMKQILEKDKDAIIILIRNDKELYHLHDRLIKCFKYYNIDENRIVFINKMPHHEMMSMYKNCDVALDSYFFGGDTTTREAFEIGTPIVTLPHKYLGTRWTQAYYKHMGITELIVNNHEEYVEKAIQVATNKAYSKSIRTDILNNVHKLFHSKDASKAWEDAFIKMIDNDNENANDNDNENANANTKINKNDNSINNLNRINNLNNINNLNSINKIPKIIIC